MELVEGVDTWPKENRQQLWLSLADAIKRATYSETRAILKVAATGG
jgi:hypothetical protein